MTDFTVAEVNLIAIYADESKEKTIENIMDSIPHYRERELVAIAETAIVKLDALSEAEFADFNFKENFCYE